MKKYKISMLFIIAFIAITCTNLNAQTNLKAWIEKCEKTPGLEVTSITYKDPDTKALQRTTTEVVFQNEKFPQLLNELNAAFDKDKDNAFRTATKSIDGKVMPETVRFQDKDKDGNRIETRFYFDYSKTKTNVTMSIYYNVKNGG